MVSGIYAIRNTTSMCVYVGQGIDVNQRFRHHRWALECGRHANGHLQASYDKYGLDAFIFEVIEVLQTPTKQDLTNAEEKWITHFSSQGHRLYNIRAAADSNAGLKASDETRKKLSAVRLGKPRPKSVGDRVRAFLLGKPKSEETKRKISESRKGQGHSEETRAKIGEASRIRQDSDETRLRKSLSKQGANNPMYGKFHSEESNKKRSESLRGERNHNYGRSPSEETRRKISDALKRRRGGDK